MAMADDQPVRPQGVTGPDEKVSVSWLILQRLEDLHDDIQAVKQDLHEEIQAVKQDLHEEIQAVKHDTNARMDELKQDLGSFKTSTDHRFEGIDRRLDTLQRQWAWAVGLIAVMALGLLAKLLIPGA